MPLGLSKFKDSLKGEKSNGASSEQQQENAAPSNDEALPTYAVTDPLPAAPEPLDGPTAEALAAAFSSLRLSDSPPSFPDPDTCLAHLKLLSAFHALKEDIGYTDGLFNLWDAKCELLDNRDESLAKMREKRWVLYIARAVERFEDWWLNVLCNGEEGGKRLEVKEMRANVLKFMEFTKRGRVQKWATSMLPPIGTKYSTLQVGYTNIGRCSYGLARLHAESSKLPRRLHQIRPQGSMGYWSALASSQRRNRH